MLEPRRPRLERAGLITRGREAQRRPCRLEARPLAEATEWLEGYRQLWEGNFQRLVATEVFDEPWYPGETVGTTVLVEKDGRTTLTNTVRYESKEARDGVLKSGMESGVEASYDRLAEVLASRVEQKG